MYSKIRVLLLATLFLLGIAAPSIAQEQSPVTSLAEFCSKLPRPEYADLNQLSAPDSILQGWFELYDVAPGVTAIYEPFQWQEVISYLIEGEKEALLFDTGNGIGDIARVALALTDKPISVLNSHTHYDHVGGNYSFERVYGMNSDYTRKNQTGHPNESIAIETSAQALCRPLPKGVTEGNHIGRPFNVSDFVLDGSIIDLGNRTLEVIHIPGHTPDAIALIDRDAGLMWTGDSYYSGPIWLFVQETDLDDYTQALDRLLEEVPNVHALLPAHNTPWVDPEVLHRVKAGFQLMLSGGLGPLDLGDGMVEYRLPGESMFSFLMRDEELPYKSERAQ